MILAEQVAHLRRTLRRLISQRLGKQTGRPLAQLLALKHIDGGTGYSQASLAEKLMMDPPAVSRLVDRLAEDGLVVRLAGENRRCVRLEVTPAGREELKLLRRAVMEMEEEVYPHHLSAEELNELKRLLDKLLTGLARPQDSAAPPESYAED